VNHPKLKIRNPNRYLNFFLKKRNPIADTLPKAQVQQSKFQLHISYFLQNCKKSKPGEMDLPYLKTISHVLNPLLGCWIHSRYQRFGINDFHIGIVTWGHIKWKGRAK
jgi:hypothetical protein